LRDKWGQARISPMSQVRFQDKTKCATSGKAGFYVEKYGPGPFDSGRWLVLMRVCVRSESWLIRDNDHVR
jgi:hypothetical protein